MRDWAGTARAAIARTVRAHPRAAGLGTGVLVAAVGAVAVVAALALRTPARSPSSVAAPAAWQRPAVSAADLVAVCGVKLVRVTVSGDGGLIDLRYQVMDADRATAAVHGASTPPAVVDEKTGLVMASLLMGHAHSGDLKPAVTYYLIFENTNGWIHRGSLVTVLLGNAQVEHVVVG